VADLTNTTYLVPDAAPGVQAAVGSRSAAASPPGQSLAAAELTNVAHRLGFRWALRGVTLRVEPGEIVAVVGPNGSGKTTLLRILATTLTPSRGGGRVFGHDLREHADAVRAAVGMLGHATGLYDDLTAAENLRFALRMYGSSPAPSGIEAALEAVGMREYAHESVRSLSSGMRRRVALARLMPRRPRLLLLDEPYNSFDDAGVALVEALVRETARVGGAALIVTHDISREGGARYDRVVSLGAGRVAERASPPARRVAP